MIARLTGRYDTIGIDLVAMSVDDIAVQGAEPLFFLDYISIGKLVPEHVDEIVAGVAHGCREAGLRAARRRDVGAPRPHGTGRVRPRRASRSASSSGAGAARGRARRATRSSASRARAALQRLLARARALLDRAGRRARRARVAGCAPLARRRAAAPERDLRARRCAELREHVEVHALRARHRRRHPRQPGPGAARRTATRCVQRGHVGGAADLRARSRPPATSPTTRWSTCSTSGSACWRSCPCATRIRCARRGTRRRSRGMDRGRDRRRARKGHDHRADRLAPGRLAGTRARTTC